MKVLASDYDGTLLFNEKFKEGDLKKIKEFQKAGNLFGLCSGRPFKGIYEFCKPYIDFDFYILCTGALVLIKVRFLSIYYMNFMIVIKKIMIFLFKLICKSIHF